jgi:ABC-type transport system involved in multi-copper enzyme maturation permease subunit
MFKYSETVNPRNCLVVMSFAWVEIARSRLCWFAIALVLIGCGIAEFGASIAITETAQHRLVFYAVSMRLASVFVMALLVSTSVLREIDDKFVELVLSRPVSRGDWYIGKFLGYITAVLCFAVLVSVPLVVQVPMQGLLWAYSLALELTIVVAAALAFAVTVRQITISLSVVAGFYILSRGIAGLVLISRGPTVDLSLTSTRFVAWLIDTLAYVLPDLDRFTRATWLVDASPSAQDLAMLTLQTTVYASLLVAVGLFDLHRRNF